MQSTQRYSSRLLASLSLIAIFTIGFGVVHFRSCKAEAASCDTRTQHSTETTIELAPRYFTYSAQALEFAQKHGKVVLYFWAPWCSSCTSLDLELQENKQEVPEGVTVLRIEYDKFPELQKQHGVTTQHTFVQIDNSGEKVSLWVGGELENFARYLQ